MIKSRKKRVSFDEASLIEQYNWSRRRREARYEDHRKMYGVLSMAMPVIMPYVIAILILVASSMVPLPKSQQQQLLTTLPYETELVNDSERTTRYEPVWRSSPPMILDIASRMWDDRTKSRKEKGYISTTDDKEQTMTVQGLSKLH